MASIGKQDATATTDLENRTVDIMTGDGSDTTLVLSSTPISINNVLIFISGILQRPTTDYTLSGTTITFSEAPPTGLKVVAITGGGEHIGIPLTRLDASKFSNSSVTNAKIASGISSSKLTGALPSLDGSALTGISHANVSGVDTVSANDPTITTNPSAVGHIWLNRVSGEMFVCTNKTVGANVWTNIGEGSGGIPYMSATNTNGTETTDGDYKVVTFNTSGSFTPNIGAAGIGDKVDYLVIAGGGGGGSGGNRGGGGGGAGGYLTATNFLVSNGSITVTVGAGATGIINSNLTTLNGAKGNNSVFSTITAIGGGGGRTQSISGNIDGGCGGGGSGSTEPSAGTGSQGGNGGIGINSGEFPGGGGGGASANGVAGSNTTAGAGGAGTASSITGNSVTRAGGGGGSRGLNSGFGAGGVGGGGTGTYSATPNNGTDNTGGGGGGIGGRHLIGSQDGSSGGSGVVIVRYRFQ